MDRLKITKLLLISFTLISAVVLFISVLDSSKVDIKKVKTEVKISTTQLFDSFDGGKRVSFDGYIDKAIEINGTLHEVTYKREKYTLLLSGERPGMFVLCEMEKDQSTFVEALKIGEQVRVKGILKGFLKDAILLNCMVIQEVDE